jgi:hydrogenase/urease accessory protein HupE
VKRSWIALVAALFALVLAPRADAHGMRTAYLELVEVEPGRATVHLRLSIADASLHVRTDPACTLTDAGDGVSVFERAWMLSCPATLEGHVLGVDGLGVVVSDVVAWASYADGTTASSLLKADAAEVSLHARTPAWSVARRYAGLGVVHILTGYDHLLFLVLLVLFVGDVRSVLLAETAFTLSHSLSFSATALGWIHVSAAAAEACIALSLVLLAADVRADRQRPPWWRGAGMALVFGLVHGLGFAGGLREIGLPEQAVPAALVSFGAGVEAAQVAFLAVVLGVVHVASRGRHYAYTRQVAVYAIGALSAYWLLARVVFVIQA